MLVKITCCKNAFEGEVVKNMLAEHGIECYLQNDDMSQIDIHDKEVNLLVREEDAEKAKSLLISSPDDGSNTHKHHSGSKSIGQILINTLVMAVFVLLLNLLFDWFKGDFASIREYALYTAVFIALYFPFNFYYNHIRK